MSEITSISISKYAKKKLDEIKERNGHTSMDSVIRTLLLRDLATKVKCNQTNCISNLDGFCRKEAIEVFGQKECWQYASKRMLAI